jgi:hypothetical protein
MGTGMGRWYRSKVTETSCQAPESFDFTNQLAPSPMWHPAQATRAWGERRQAVNSGSMTEWQDPQKAGDSITWSPL